MEKRSELRKLSIIMLLLVVLAGVVYAGASIQIGETNLTVWDDSDSRSVYETPTTKIYANYTNVTDSLPIENANCSLFFDSDARRNLTYNATSGAYELSLYMVVGNHTYNVSCNKTDYNWLNTSTNITIPNRNPVMNNTIPAIAISEDSYNDSINLSEYFVEYDSISQYLSWNYTATENITITINNYTGILNITPDENFYGIRNVTITAIDPLNATNSTNITIIVSNKPEVNLSSPAEGESSFYSNDSIQFKALVTDDYNITSCSLYINSTLNQTITNPSIGAEAEALNDTGVAASNEQIKVAQTLERLNLTSTNYAGFKAYLSSSSGIGPIIVEINGYNLFNISASEVSSSPGWVSKTLNSSVLVLGKNNITLEDANYLAPTHFKIGKDINSQYMIRFTNDYIIFDPVSLPKGDWNWNVKCSNNQSQSKTTEEWNLTVQNSAPTTPTTLTPDSGTFDNEVNITCSGSTDIDGDEITYSVYYRDQTNADYQLLFENSAGEYTWNTSNISSSTSINLLCNSSDSTNHLITYIENLNAFTISHPGSPSTPINLTCNEVNCTNGIFGDEINISCFGSNDTDSFDYVIEAYYEDWNGTEWHTLATVTASNGQNGTGNYTWDTKLIMNQTSIKIQCYADDSVSEESSALTATNITMQHSNPPTIPSTFNPTNGTFDDEINVSCGGSTGTGNIDYEAYAYYKSGWVSDEEWNTVNDSLIESTIYSWNTSSLPEQDISIKCRAYNGTYYSNFNTSGNGTIRQAPTTPTTVEPSSGIHEYEINYSCRGSNNLDPFNYTIETYYDAGWHTLTQNFTGVPIIDDNELALDDNVYSTIQYRTSGTESKSLTFNVPNGNYSYCVKGYGVGSNINLKLYWDCRNDAGNINCEENNIFDLSGTSARYCADVVLEEDSIQYLKIETISLGVITTYFDHAYLVPKALNLNVTGITAQRDVQFRCLGNDSQGESDWLYSENLTIDRIPKFNTSKSFPDSDYIISWKEGTNLLNYFSLSDYFYDEDGDSLTFGVLNPSEFVDVNETTGNVSLYGNSFGERIITFTADDGLAVGYFNMTLDIESRGGGGGGQSGYTAEEAEEAGIDVYQPVTPDTGDGGPVIEQPTVIDSGKKDNKTVIESAVIQSVFNTKIKHTRKYFLSRSKTRIVETLKNIGFYGLEDTIIRITVPKSIARYASEIIGIDDFVVVENDPVIDFFIPKIDTDQEIEISYMFDKRLKRGEIDKIRIEIIPKNLTAEEIAEKERLVQEKIEDTSKYVDVTTAFVSDYEKGETEFKIDLDVEEGAILYNVSIFAEIPKCLVEILKEEMVESDIDFEIIAEDPLIRWHFDKLSAAEEINYMLKTVADENCTNKVNVMPLAHSILLLTAKAKLANALIPLLAIPIIILMITFFSAYGFEEKEKITRMMPWIKWARRVRKQGISWQAISALLRKTKGYSEKTINQLMKFSSSLPKLTFTKLEIDIEESIVILLIVLNILDFLKLLPGEIAFAKVVISWTILGYILFQASITRILFGNRSKKLDIVLLAAYFMLVMKNLVKIAETEFIEAGYMKDMYILIANNNYIFESVLFMIGISIIILSSIYIAARMPVSRKSFMGALGEFGAINHSIFKFISRTFTVFIFQAFFFIVVFNLIMEWLAIAVDAALLTSAIVFYLFVLIKHRKKHWLVEIIYKVANIGEKFYERFVELFHNRKTIFIGLAGMLMLHTLTEIGIFIIPYVLGIYNPLYFASWQIGHTPIFNIYGWLRSIIGIKSAQVGSLFTQGIVGMGLPYSLILFLLYTLNIIAIVFLLSIPVFVWHHLYKYRKKPVSEVPKLMFSKITISMFISSFIAFIFAGAFMIKGLYLRGLMGVDILTLNISQNPNLDLILAVSLAAGLLAYALMRFSSRIKHILNWAVLAVSFVFFFRYIILFFTSVVIFYASTIATLTYKNLFISMTLLIFMVMTIIFYGAGILGLAFELWLRDEVGLRKIVRIKNLPEWMKHFDMSYIHHEKFHEHRKHGKKFELLKRYMLLEIRRGHKFSTILLHLLKVGWSVEVIEEALEALEENNEFNDCMKKMKRKNAEEITKLALYIRKELDKGIKLHKIIKMIAKSGWTDTDLLDAFRIIEIK